jgi:hypothetical protein
MTKPTDKGGRDAFAACDLGQLTDSQFVVQ